MEMNNMDYYINLEEAANYLGIKPVTLRSWIKDPENEIPAHKIGLYGSSSDPRLMSGFRAEKARLRIKPVLWDNTDSTMGMDTSNLIQEVI